MKKSFSVMVLLLLMAAGIAGCSGNGKSPSTDEVTTNSPLANRISQAMQDIMDNKDGKYDEGGYIVYDAETDSLLTCDAHTYGIARMIQSGMSQGDTVDVKSSAPPQEDDWANCGTCKGKAETLQLATQIEGKSSKGSNMDIYVEPQRDGTYKVSYRPAK